MLWIKMLGTAVSDANRTVECFLSFLMPKSNVWLRTPCLWAGEVVKDHQSLICRDSTLPFVPYKENKWLSHLFCPSQAFFPHKRHWLRKPNEWRVPSHGPRHWMMWCPEGRYMSRNERINTNSEDFGISLNTCLFVFAGSLKSVHFPWVLPLMSWILATFMSIQRGEVDVGIHMVQISKD